MYIESAYIAELCAILFHVQKYFCSTPVQLHTLLYCTDARALYSNDQNSSYIISFFIFRKERYAVFQNEYKYLV